MPIKDKREPVIEDSPMSSVSLLEGRQTEKELLICSMFEETPEIKAE